MTANPVFQVTAGGSNCCWFLSSVVSVLQDNCGRDEYQGFSEPVVFFPGVKERQ